MQPEDIGIAATGVDTKLGSGTFHHLQIHLSLIFSLGLKIGQLMNEGKRIRPAEFLTLRKMKGSSNLRALEEDCRSGLEKRDQEDRKVHPTVTITDVHVPPSMTLYPFYCYFSFH